jgi:hypothetical protein
VLRNEAKWIGRVVSGLPADAFPLLNVGSQTEWFRRVDQPYMDTEIFEPLRRAGKPVVHTDLREGDGVDVSGDLMDAAFRQQLLDDYGIRSVLCCNVLEHVSDPVVLSEALVRIVLATGGHFVVSVPRQFPYHPDPIDTMFRPSCEQLAGILSPLTPVSTAEVSCGTLVTYGLGRMSTGRRTAVENLRASATDSQSGRPRRRLSDLAPWTIRRFVVTCGWFRSPVATGEGDPR